MNKIEWILVALLFLTDPETKEAKARIIKLIIHEIKYYWSPSYQWANTHKIDLYKKEP